LRHARPRRPRHLPAGAPRELPPRRIGLPVPRVGLRLLRIRLDRLLAVARPVAPRRPRAPHDRVARPPPRHLAPRLHPLRRPRPLPARHHRPRLRPAHARRAPPVARAGADLLRKRPRSPPPPRRRGWRRLCDAGGGVFRPAHTVATIFTSNAIGALPP